MDGPDHKASLDPLELKAMVNAIRNIEGIGKRSKEAIPLGDEKYTGSSQEHGGGKGYKKKRGFCRKHYSQMSPSA